MRKRYVPLKHIAISLFDIALHDGKAKSLDKPLPLYRMLGEARHENTGVRFEPIVADG